MAHELNPHTELFYELINHGLSPQDMLPYFEDRGATMVDILEIAHYIAHSNAAPEPLSN